MPITPPPATIRQALAQSSQAAVLVSPDVGFGSRAARPFEEPGKANSWSGDCQLTGIDVKWEDTFTIERGASKDADKSTPCAAISLAFVTKLDNGSPVSWTTRRYRWVYGDPATVLPDSNGDYIRRRARDDMAVIMGWFQALLGTTSSDPVIRDPSIAVPAIDAMIQVALTAGAAVTVKAGYVKTIDSFTYKKGEKKGQKGQSENVTDYVYKNYSAETSAGS